jgi:hypothetical protein
MEIIGTIKKINSAVQITPTFSKSEMVITTDEMYPQTILVEFAQSRAGLVDAFQVGQYVKVAINLRGREWQDPKTGEVRYFTSVSGWKIDLATPGQAVVPAAANPFATTATPAAAVAPAPAAPVMSDGDDDLPF